MKPSCKAESTFKYWREDFHGNRRRRGYTRYCKRQTNKAIRRFEDNIIRNIISNIQEPLKDMHKEITSRPWDFI